MKINIAQKYVKRVGLPTYSVLLYSSTKVNSLVEKEKLLSLGQLPIIQTDLFYHIIYAKYIHPSDSKSKSLSLDKRQA